MVAVDLNIKFPVCSFHIFRYCRRLVSRHFHEVPNWKQMKTKEEMVMNANDPK